MSCVNTGLMSFLISCVFVSCFAHGSWFVCWPCACVFVLCEHIVFFLVFCVPCALMSICFDPTHLVSWLLVNLPHLSHLAVLGQFVVVCSPVVCWSCPALPDSCHVFPLRGSFSLFVLFYFINSYLEGIKGKKHKPFALILVSVVIVLKGDLYILKQTGNWQACAAVLWMFCPPVSAPVTWLKPMNLKPLIMNYPEQWRQRQQTGENVPFFMLLRALWKIGHR